MAEYDFLTQFERTKRFLNEHEKLKRFGYERINFGCGSHPLPGWTNTDGGDGKWWLAPSKDEIVQLDIAEFLALVPDNSVSYITSEQFFEHFAPDAAREILRQWHRILQPSGVLRIQVPSLYYLCKLYLNEVPFADWEKVQKPRRLKQFLDGAGDNSANHSKDPYKKLAENEELLPCYVSNMAFYSDGHQFMYDFAYLKQMLHLLAFHSVVECKFGESKHKALRGIDKHDGGETGKGWIPEIALCVEATK